MKKETQIPDATKNSAEFAALINLLSLFSQATNQLAALETQANQELLQLLEKEMPQFAVLQSTLTEAEKQAKEIVARHPEWFTGGRKSIKTPYGTVKSTSTSKLEPMDSEDASVTLVEREAEINKEFDAKLYLHSKKTLNLEALEKMEASALSRFRLKRVKTESISVSPAKVEMGKAVEEAVQAEAA